MLFFLQHPSFLAFLPLFIFIVFLSKWMSATRKTHKLILPPSPPKLPIIGNLHQLGNYPHRSLQSLAQRYGPLMLLHLGSVPMLVVSSADAAREIIKTHDLIFSNRPKLSIPHRLLYGSKDITFSTNGEHWRHVRSIGVQHLLSNRKVQSFRNVREEETTLMIEKIRKSSSSSSSSSLVNLSEMFASLTNDVVCRVALGRKYSSGGEDGKKFKRLLAGLVQFLGIFSVGDYIPWLSWVNFINGLDAKIENLAREFDGFLEGVVQEHMDQKKGETNGSRGGSGKGEGDFVDTLLNIQRDNVAGIPIHRDTIKALILDVFAAGTDSTAAVLEWAMTELLRHPKAMKELQNEVREVARGKSEISEDDLEKMPYLKAVIKESLRLHAPGALLPIRKSSQDVKVMGYDIAAGTQVIINAWAIGRDPSSWEKPEEFRPHRFLNTCVDFRGQHFQFLPFGAGRRSCPGTQFSISVDELALAKVVHAFDLALPGGARGEDLDVTEASGITIHKRSPLFVVATPYFH